MQYNVLASLRQVSLSLCQYETRYILISTTSFFNHFQYPIFAKCTALCACCTRIRIVHNRLTEFVVRISFHFIRSFQFASDGRHTHGCDGWLVELENGCMRWLSLAVDRLLLEHNKRNKRNTKTNPRNSICHSQPFDSGSIHRKNR